MPKSRAGHPRGEEARHGSSFFTGWARAREKWFDEVSIFRSHSWGLKKPRGEESSRKGGQSAGVKGGRGLFFAGDTFSTGRHPPPSPAAPPLPFPLSTSAEDSTSTNLLRKTSNSSKTPRYPTVKSRRSPPAISYTLFESVIASSPPANFQWGNGGARNVKFRRQQNSFVDIK